MVRIESKVIEKVETVVIVEHEKTTTTDAPFYSEEFFLWAKRNLPEYLFRQVEVVHLQAKKVWAGWYWGKTPNFYHSLQATKRVLAYLGDSLSREERLEILAYSPGD